MNSGNASNSVLKCSHSRINNGLRNLRSAERSINSHIRFGMRPSRYKRCVSETRVQNRNVEMVKSSVRSGSTGLFPLAAHGGPLWEPLCYAQIGGLTIATFVTLLLVPVLYSFVVLDLKLIRWEQTEHTASAASEKPAEMPAISGVHA